MKTAAFGALSVLLIGGCSAPEALVPAPTPTLAPVTSATPATALSVAPVAPVASPSPTFDAAWAVESERQNRENAAADAKAAQDTRDMLASQHQQQTALAVDHLHYRISKLQSQKEQTRNLSERDDLDREIQGLQRQIDEQRAAP